MSILTKIKILAHICLTFSLIKNVIKNGSKTFFLYILLIGTFCLVSVVKQLVARYLSMFLLLIFTSAQKDLCVVNVVFYVIKMLSIYSGILF